MDNLVDNIRDTMPGGNGCAMYNHQLDTFIVVAETGSFAKAAGRLFISSSAVIQQINNLEKNLKVTLFNRGRKGVTLTEAGTYLLGQARESVARNELLRKKILEIGSRDKVICIGTSFIEKCRLLYELWVLFTMKNKVYEIRMITIEDKQKGMQEAELVESICSGAAWQRDLEFLEFGRIPYGFAVSKDHPLAGKKQFVPEELKGQTVAVICQGKTDPVIPACREVEKAGAEVLYYEAFSPSIIWDCSYYHRMLLVPVIWDDVLFDVTVKPCSWDFSVPYGIFYRKDLSGPAAEFLSFIRETCRKGSSQLIAPVFG